MKCFDCGNRRRGTFPYDHKYTCVLDQVKKKLVEVNKCDYLTTEQMLASCGKYWMPKPKPLPSDWNELLGKLAKTNLPSVQRALQVEFNERFDTGKRPRKSKKPQGEQLEMDYA